MPSGDSSAARPGGRSSVRRGGPRHTGTRLNSGRSAGAGGRLGAASSADPETLQGTGRKAPAGPNESGQAAAEETPLSEAEREYQRAKEIVLRQLGMMARSRAELAEKLAAKEISEETAERVLDRFEELKLIDDAAFAEAFVRSRASSRRLARPALRRELARKGVTGEVAEAALEQRTEDQEREDAAALVRKKVRPDRDLVDRASREKALRRLASMLARRGYSPHVSFEIAQQVLQDAAEDQRAED